MKKTTLKHLIYASKPVKFHDANIGNILQSSRKNNKENEITGALIFREDIYLQFLEGPEKKINESYKLIKTDNRHKDVFKIRENLTKRRLFTSWAMRGDPVKTWMWSYDEIESGIMKKLTPDDAFSLFERLSREIDQFS
jgi:hypothetical protein